MGRWGFRPIDSVKNTIAWWPTRQRYTDAALIDEESLTALTHTVNQTHPALIEGYVGAMLEFAHQKRDGRATDIVRMPSGTALNHRVAAMFSQDPEAVRLFQLHQHADYSITVRVMATEVAGTRSKIERAVQALRDRIANEVPVTVEYVDSLPYNRGETKYVISDVEVTT